MNNTGSSDIESVNLNKEDLVRLLYRRGRVSESRYEYMEKLGNVLIQVMQDLSRISTNGSAHVRVNSQLCNPQEFEKLFNYFTKGTILERVDLNVDPLQTQMECSCGAAQDINEQHPGYMRCPNCGRFAEIKDDSYKLIQPDPDKVGERKSIRF